MTMQRPVESTVYRVAPGPVNTWKVYAGPAREPVASFADRSAAVRFALHLARGQVSWQPLMAASAGGPAQAAVS